MLGRIGYLSEDRDLPDWMRVGELMRYTQAFFPDLGRGLRRGAARRRSISTRDARIKNLSRGQRARAGLLAALAHRPELLVLDEPSSGLDPVVRRDILGAIIRTIADEGRTVLFSSHLLDEVERVADRVAIIHQGRIVLTSLDGRNQGHAPPRDAAVRPAASNGRRRWSGDLLSRPGRRVDLRLQRRERAIAAGGRGDRRHGRRRRGLSLDEIFVSRMSA